MGARGGPKALAVMGPQNPVTGPGWFYIVLLSFEHIFDVLDMLRHVIKTYLPAEPIKVAVYVFDP